MTAMVSHAIYNNTIYSVLGWLSSVRIILKTKWLSSVRTVAPKRDNNHQTARAMRDAANQEGGLAGLGAGLAFGNTIAQNVQNISSSNVQSKSKVEQLRELKGLLDDGILTQEEFDAEKKRILGN
ncbi:SHOCT domain-containing protein [Frisingicoccus caecimuris]|nr:SHOCT domain-containing protein [Frisingicoccus caecimuris]